MQTVTSECSLHETRYCLLLAIMSNLSCKCQIICCACVRYCRENVGYVQGQCHCSLKSNNFLEI